MTQSMRERIARRIMLHDLQLLHDFDVDGDLYRKDPECRDAAYVEADAIIAALPELQGWQPIETAPKDEVILIAYHGDEVGTGLWWLNDEWTCDQEETTLTPTYWMPLPDPPAKALGIAQEGE